MIKRVAVKVKGMTLAQWQTVYVYQIATASQRNSFILKCNIAVQHCCPAASYSAVSWRFSLPKNPKYVD